MLFPRLATRLLARSASSASKLVLGHVPVTQITRSFSVSSVAWARAGAAATASKKKASTKKAPANKKSTTKSAKKPASKKKKAKKSLRPPGRPKKKVVKKKEGPVRIRPGDKPPKRPAASYGVFTTEQLKSEQVPEGTTSTQYIANKAKEVSASWRALSEQEKQPYIEQAAAAAADYKRRLEEYIKTTDPQIIKEINRRRSEKGKTKLKRFHRHTNGFILFTLEERQKRPSPTSLDEGKLLVRDLGQAWNALPDEAKQSYRERAITRNAEQKQR